MLLKFREVVLVKLIVIFTWCRSGGLYLLLTDFMLHLESK